MNIPIQEKFTQEKESTIQYDVSELLQTDLSDFLKKQLEKFDNNNVNKFLYLFPIGSKTKISEIKNSLDKIKEILPDNLLEEIMDEVKEIIADYEWIKSKDGKKILEIEEWIKRARKRLSIDFPTECIYIGRSFIEPVSLIIGGYVNNSNIKNLIETYFNKMNPPITIEFKINVYYQ